MSRTRTATLRAPRGSPHDPHAHDGDSLYHRFSGRIPGLSPQFGFHRPCTRSLLRAQRSPASLGVADFRERNAPCDTHYRRPEIEVVSVIASAHLRSYERSGTSSTVAHRNRLIAASDRYLVLDETSYGGYAEQLGNILFERCDRVLYNGDEPHREQFMRRVCRLGIPTPIAFLPRYTVQ